MRRVGFRVRLTVRGPVITKSSSIGGYGVDSLMAKTTVPDGKGSVATRYCLPGTLVKGLLRESWQELGSEDSDVQKRLSWLGQESPKGTNDPERSRLNFSDFLDFETDTLALRPSRYRIQIEEERGAADAGKLLVMESPYAPGATVHFVGTIRAIVGEKDDVDGLQKHLEFGLRWIRALGGARTVGFGVLETVEIARMAEMPVPQETELLATEALGESWRIRLGFATPVIFSKRPISLNQFDSEDSISGAALKGAIATMIERDQARFSALAAELHGVRFTHALPAKTGKPRPRQWPMSLLAFAEGTVIEDVIRCNRPIFRDGEAGSFDVDWKERRECATVRKKYGWPKIKTELRVRTGICSDTRRAREGALFGWQMLTPHGLEWVGEVHASGISEMARRQLLELLKFGLEPLGKTKALASVGVEDISTADIEVQTSYVVTLVTPALLIDPSRHLAQDNTRPGRSDEDSMRAEFADVWRDLSEGSMELKNYFHRCSLAGGEYYQRRFQYDQKQYRPYLLTDAGSTFLLEPVSGREADAFGKLNAWQQRGLPLTAAIRRFYGLATVSDDEMWRHCTYLPENGYGEVAVNQELGFAEAAECTTK